VGPLEDEGPFRSLLDEAQALLPEPTSLAGAAEAGTGGGGTAPPGMLS
jgi:hypothetical protein